MADRKARLPTCNIQNCLEGNCPHYVYSRLPMYDVQIYTLNHDSHIYTLNLDETPLRHRFKNYLIPTPTTALALHHSHTAY